jgi:hypothetical protein
VVVTAPETVAPGYGSASAAVQAFVGALNAGSLIQTCMYYAPSAQVSCRAVMAKAVTGSGGTIRNFALGYAAVDGNEALVGSTGTFCSPDATPTCVSNEDPAAIFSEAKPFPKLWAESVAADASTTTSNTYSLAPCVKVGNNWYLYNSGPGGNS